jgi:hypothetical protein
VLAIDLYNKAYQGGNRPVREVNRLHEGSCGEKRLEGSSRRGRCLPPRGRPACGVLHHRHADTDGVRSTHRRMGAEAESPPSHQGSSRRCRVSWSPQGARLAFGTPLIAHLRKAALTA